MHNGVYNEIPTPIKPPLIPISVDLIRIQILLMVRHQRIEAATLELHLLFVVLVVDDVRAALAALEDFRLLPLLLIINLTHGLRDALALVFMVQIFWIFVIHFNLTFDPLRLLLWILGAPWRIFRKQIILYKLIIFIIQMRIKLFLVHSSKCENRNL